MTTLTTDIEHFAQQADERYGYAPAEDVRDACDRILAEGKDVVLYTNHDLGSLGSRPLATIQALPRAVETPQHASDTDYIGLGWRYLPELRLTIEEEF